MKKRLSAVLLFAILILSLLTGCSGNSNISLDDIPAFTDKAYVVINDNIPFFTDDEITSEAFENYSPLDALGRCGVAFACIGVEIMPTENREEIGSVTPSGWKYNNQSNNKKYDFVLVNYSNPDMIGHTGNYEATVKSLEYMDKCVNKVLKCAKKNGYFVMITADHGNSEEMKTKKGEPNTAHSINKVFCSVVGVDCKVKKSGELKDVAPTFVELLGLKPNKHFEGKSLII